ncbi:hypothetical protein Q5530_01915 [Saccharothrix sp. BKS2]
MLKSAGVVVGVVLAGSAVTAAPALAGDNGVGSGQAVNNNSWAASNSTA